MRSKWAVRDHVRSQVKKLGTGNVRLVHLTSRGGDAHQGSETRTRVSSRRFLGRWVCQSDPCHTRLKQCIIFLMPAAKSKPARFGSGFCKPLHRSCHIKGSSEETALVPSVGLFHPPSFHSPVGHLPHYATGYRPHYLKKPQKLSSLSN